MLFTPTPCIHSQIKKRKQKLKKYLQAGGETTVSCDTNCTQTHLKAQYFYVGYFLD